MNRISPILLWVGASLLLLCLLPFGLSSYQIAASRERLIEQSQRTHLLAARTAAQRVESRIGNLAGLLRTLGNFRDLYIAPDSQGAQALLRSAVESESGLLALGLVLRQGDAEAQRIVEIRTADIPDAIPELINIAGPAGVTFRSIEGRVMMLSAEPSARPGVWLVAVHEDLDLPGILRPEELGGSADVFLIDTDAWSLLLAPPGLLEVPSELQTLIGYPGVRSAAAPVRWPDIGDSVAAFARIAGTPYVVVSRQPVHVAENLSGELRRTAWTIFAAVSLVAALMLITVSLKVVRPIRRIVGEQRELAGLRPRAGAVSGGEIAELGETFEALKRNELDREALSEIFVDRYRVIRCIGIGGMGSVYLGMDPKLRRPVALKTLNFQYLGGTERDQAFRRLREEAVVAASLAHRNIVGIHDIIEGTQGAFIAMELVDGESLSSILDRTDCLSLRQTMPIVVAVLRGLIAAHELDMVHRDIKPANVLVGRNGDIKLTDFGTAAPVAAGRNSQRATVGTPGYIAPESIISGQFSDKSDVFAVGVLTIMCLTGEMPFEGRSTEQIFQRTTGRPVDFARGPLATLPWPVIQAIQAMIERDPALRPTAANALAGLLKAWDEPVTWQQDWFDVRSILETEKLSDERPTERLVGAALPG